MIDFSCTCGKMLRAKEEAAGKRTKCPQCGAIIPVPGQAAKVAAGPEAAAKAHPGQAIPDNPDALPIDLVWPSTELYSTPVAQGDAPQTGDKPAGAAGAASATGEPPRPSDLPKPTDGTIQYKVLTQKDISPSGKFNSLRLEEALNEHSRLGWVVRSAVTIDVASHAGHHDELIVILER